MCNECLYFASLKSQGERVPLDLRDYAVPTRKDDGPSRPTERSAMNAGQRIIADLVDNGGGTYVAGTLDPFMPDDGYAVGIAGIEVNASDLTAEVAEVTMRDLAKEHGAYHVGTWEKDGIVYIDAVRYFGGAGGQSAVRFAREHNQQELYSFADRRSLRPGQVVFDQ